MPAHHLFVCAQVDAKNLVFYTPAPYNEHLCRKQILRQSLQIGKRACIWGVSGELKREGIQEEVKEGNDSGGYQGRKILISESRKERIQEGVKEGQDSEGKGGIQEGVKGGLRVESYSQERSGTCMVD
jgi:hypothetical protein